MADPASWGGRHQWTVSVRNCLLHSSLFSTVLATNRFVLCHYFRVSRLEPNSILHVQRFVFYCDSQTTLGNGHAMKKTKNADGQDIVLFEFDEDQIEVLEVQFESVSEMIMIYCILNDESIDDNVITRDRLLSIKELHWQFDPDHPQKQISQSIVQRYKTVTQYCSTKYVEKNLSGWMKTANYFFKQLNPMLYDVMDYMEQKPLWKILENEPTTPADTSSELDEHKQDVESNADDTHVKYKTYKPGPKSKTKDAEYCAMVEAYELEKSSAVNAGKPDE